VDPQKPLLIKQPRVPLVTSETNHDTSVTRTVATRDHDLIRRWAASRQADPATGEATSSGPATVDVTDGGAGIRFNFPGVSRFRQISWQEWFDHFDLHELTFVYEQTPEGAGQLTSRYRLVKTADWKEEVG
jgi:hypothetical protein